MCVSSYNDLLAQNCYCTGTGLDKCCCNKYFAIGCVKVNEGNALNTHTAIFVFL